MDGLKTSVARMLASIRESGWAGGVGPGGVVLGILLVALGWILEEQSVGVGGAIRTLGGVLLLCGLAVVVFGDTRRRAAALGAAERIYARYMARTAHWAWPDRVGLAGVIVGAALVVPALAMQIIFRNGAVVALPAVIIFWCGVVPSHLREILRPGAGSGERGMSSWPSRRRQTWRWTSRTSGVPVSITLVMPAKAMGGQS